MADSALILRSWMRWGGDCAGKLAGPYAFAVYDMLDNSLSLTRSPRGERPLLFFPTEKGVAFASAPCGLFALPFVDRSLNRTALADLLLARPAEPGSTLYRGIQSVRPGHTIVFRPASTETVCFWSARNLKPIRFRRDQEYVDAFVDLFDRAVEDSLRSASPVGIMLSGGLDSTSVAASAARTLARTGATLSSFTEIPEHPETIPTMPGRYFDETPYVEMIKRRYPNIESRYVNTPGRFFLDGADRFFAAAEVPFRNASNRVWWESIQQLASDRNIRVLLTGQMGNLTISWNGSRLIPRLIAQGKLLRALSEARGVARIGQGRSTLGTVSSALLTFLPDHLWLLLNRVRRPDSIFFSPQYPWRTYSPIHPEFFIEQRMEERARDQRYNWQLRENAHARIETLEHTDHGADMRRGQEALYNVQLRAPSNDQRIVEFCLSIPEDQFLHDGLDRRLLRRAMADRLPREILDNRKRGVQAADWVGRLICARPKVLAELDLQERCDLVRSTIDVPGLRKIVLEVLPGLSSASPESPFFRRKVECGLMTGRFLRWFSTGA